MSKSIDECIKHLNSIIEDCETYDFITRDSEFQHSSCESLRMALEQCASLKAQAIEKKEEQFSNILLGFECVINSLIGTLSMWMLLKEGKPDEAWDQLVDAQAAATYAAKADMHFSHLLERAKDLELIERLIFPPQVFVSAGLIVRRQECSICGSEYGECEHLAGKPYWGEFCAIVAKDIEANHVAVVKDPADKRCRIVQFTIEGGDRNRMTWKVGPPDLSGSRTLETQNNPDENHLLAQANLIYTSNRS